jgi:hypothetical protein
MLACRLFGHRFRFRSQGATMQWTCERGCGEGGSKRYTSPEDARRFARAFDHGADPGVGRRPTLSTSPLWLLRRLRR